MVRRLLIAVLIFFLAVLVAVDRLGAIVAAHVFAGKVQTYEHLPNRPKVTIGGIPFLTQALSGNYNDVTVQANNVPIDGVSVSTFTAHLRGVHIPVSSVRTGSVKHVPVDEVDANAFISLDAINTYLSGHQTTNQRLILRAGPDEQVTVVDRFHVHGKPVTLRGLGSVTLANNVVNFAISRYTSAAVLTPAVNGEAFSEVLRALSMPLGGLPFRIQLQSVIVTSTGLSISGAAHNVILGNHQN